MKRIRSFACLITGLMMIWLFMGGFSGCATLSRETDTAKGPSSGKGAGALPLYQDFGDVAVPKELKVQRQDSTVFRAQGISAGVLSFRGMVELNSLMAFFEKNMVKDKWKLVSSFKSSRSILLYQKENRWCVVTITENDFYTDVEIWVAPLVEVK